MNTFPTPSSHQSSIVDDATYILPGYSASAPPQPLSCFGDDVWDLSARQGARNRYRHQYIVDFRRLTDPERRLVAKEYLYARLNAHLPHQSRLTYGCLRLEFNLLVRFFTYLDSVWDGLPLQSVTQPVLDGFLNWCQHGTRGTPPAAETVAHSVAIVCKLWAYRMYLSRDSITFIPWEGRSTYQVVGMKFNPDNATPSIPETVLNPLTQWALFYVQTAAHDILAAHHEMAQFPARPVRSWKERRSRLASWLEQRRTKQRGIPAHEGVLARARRRAEQRGIPAHEGVLRLHSKRAQKLPGVNVHLISRMAGIRKWDDDSELTVMLQQAVAELGMEPGGMDTPISEYPLAHRPWRGRFSPESLRDETRMLVTACYIVIAYFSGMRDSEVSYLKRGCHLTETSADGYITRHKVRGTTFKRRGRQGVEATWVVIQPVAEAIAVLEQITDRDFLFWPSVVQTGTPAKGVFSMKHRLSDFRDHINATQQDQGPPPIPAVDGAPWPLQTRQFRRTLAWHIVRQPFGFVAGKIQYQHVSVVTFEGYAGESDSGFRNEVEAERELQQLEDIVERYEEVRQGKLLAGPGAARMTAIFRQVQEQLGDFPGTIADPARVRAMLLQVARTLYPGILNDCYFEPSVALCLRGTKKNKPLLPVCHPDKCPNSCFSQRHLVHWQNAKADATRHLKQQRLSVYQKEALRVTIADFDRVIVSLEGESETHESTDGTETTPSDGTIAEREGDPD